MSAADTGLHRLTDTEEREKLPRGEAVRQLLRLLWKYPRPLALGLLALVLATIAALYEPRIFGYAVDLAIVPKDWEMLKRLAAVYLGVVVVRVLGAIGQAYFFEQLGQRVCQDLRCRLFERLLRSPVSVFDRNPTGRLLTRVTNDVSGLGEMFSAGFVSMAGNALMVIGISAWLLILDLQLGLVALAVFPFVVGASIHFSGKLKKAYRESRSRLSALNAFLAENILGMRIVHLFNRERLHLERFQRVNDWYAEAQISSVRIFAVFQPIITLASGLAIALVIEFGGLRSARGDLPIGVLVAYFSYVLTMFQPIREIADKWNIFLSGMASAERIFTVLTWPEEKGAVSGLAPAGAQALPQLRGEIVFENVWFAYTHENWVLKDFSLKIEAGTHVGVVGHTGAGKTTLLSLLLRFYEPQRGRILLDGRELREYPLQALRAAFGVIQQDGYLFSGSLEENVALWGEEVPPGGVREALAAAGLSLEDFGIADRELNERATNISMGQKQVLAFARAVLAKPRMWILDEATANVDSGTEAALQRGLERVSRGSTALLIAHRLSTIRACDRILVLHRGAVVEDGTHPELIKKEGLYARLYRYQAARESHGSQTV